MEVTPNSVSKGASIKQGFDVDQGLNLAQIVCLAYIYVRYLRKCNNSYIIQIKCQIILQSDLIRLLLIFTAYFLPIAYDL